ncbi:T9SS type A sorting domain-containing protein [candidate division KSB1 bacterium]|nr:T9SS type A sorting domain-containing protein [candidate division KSB1 bacterium]RQW10190.1 MAG: T9SS C-terminal target domain-containing protein [candidate division KSB1 bacterium]
MKTQKSTLKSVMVMILVFIFMLSAIMMAATEQAKQAAIDAGLAWLASAQNTTTGHWEFGDIRSDLAATASAALAFIEEGYLPNDGSMYGETVAKAVNYILNGAQVFILSEETAGYWHHSEDYNNSLAIEAGEGNGQAVQFHSADIYSNGITAPIIFALGQKLGKNTIIGGTSPVAGMTYAELMQDIIDWFSWAQVEPDRGNYRGGWRYYPNYSTSDNSTAQWGSLPMLYAASWGLQYPQYVVDELELWVNYIQNANGGSGYDNPNTYVNVSKTGGLLLQLAAIGAGIDDLRVQKALEFINSHWTDVPSGIWYGNIDHPYAMWALYKALEVWDFMEKYGSGAGEDFFIGTGMSGAPGGFIIGQDWWDPTVSSLAGDWYSHYCDVLVDQQNPDGSWNGYSYWTSALAVGWYINILNATGSPPPQTISVFIDIHPQSCPNPLNPKSKGVVPVAILGTDEFDVTTIDPGTILLDRNMDDELAGVAPLRWAFEDVATPFEGDECNCHTEGADGYVDMTLKFDTQAVIAALGDVNDGDLFPLVVTGMLLEEFGGTDVEGSDCVIINLKNNLKKELVGTVGAVPTEFALSQNQPNPFNPQTSIEYSVPTEEFVTLEIYDLRGSLVRRLVNEAKSIGHHTIVWDGLDEYGSPVVTGMYLYRMVAGDFSKARKMTILR